MVKNGKIHKMHKSYEICNTKSYCSAGTVLLIHINNKISLELEKKLIQRKHYIPIQK